MFGHPEWLECSICGLIAADVAEALLASEVEGQVRYGHGPRCRDRHACRDRVELAGFEWPLADQLSVTPRRRVSA